MQDAAKARARQHMYTWLSLAFYKPEEDFLSEDFVPMIASSLGILQYGMQEETGRLAELLKGEADLQTLLLEYARLFVGPAALLAPPYGSCYLEGGRVMGVTTLAAEQEYARQGMMMLPGVKDLPDHIAVEMSFLSYLCEFELECLRKGEDGQGARFRGLQHDFLQQHPLTWVHPFTDAVLKNTSHPFYVNAAAILRQVLVRESQVLAAGRSY